MLFAFYRSGVVRAGPCPWLSQKKLYAQRMHTRLAAMEEVATQRQRADGLQVVLDTQVPHLESLLEEER